MLVFLGSPALGAWVFGLPAVPGPRPGRTWSSLGWALLAACAIVVPASVVAFLSGTLVSAGPPALGGAVAGAVTGLVTSTIEELGWSAGGTRLARAALGPRGGVVALGVLWAAWHLVVAWLGPPETVAGLFGTADPLGVPRTSGLLFLVGAVAAAWVVEVGAPRP